jgi:hypothetical protein
MSMKMSGTVKRSDGPLGVAERELARGGVAQLKTEQLRVSAEHATKEAPDAAGAHHTS